jgi:hypothetical protein
MRSTKIQLAVPLTAPLGGAIPPNKKEMKKIFLLAIATMVIAPCVTFAASAPAKVKIGATLAFFDDVFENNLREAMTNWAKAHPDVELSILDARRQQTPLNALIPRDVKVPRGSGDGGRSQPNQAVEVQRA